MDRLVISDTSCLIVLTNAYLLQVLPAMFGEITITPEIVSEYAQPLPDWIRVALPVDPGKQYLLEDRLDRGEASAISLALENPGALLLIDEKKGRQVAAALGLQVMGTIRLLVLARQKGLIPSLSAALAAIQRAGFWLAPRLLREVLDKYGD